MHLSLYVEYEADLDMFIHMSSQLMKRYKVFKKSEMQQWREQDGGSLAPSAETDILPLVVNTDGWVKGLGYKILSAIIGAVSPAHIVQIFGSTKAKSFDMSSQNVVLNNSIKKMFEGSSANGFDDDIQSWHLIDISGNNTESSTSALLATASEHCTHRICAYFLGGYRKMFELCSSHVGENEPNNFHKEKGLCDPNNIIGLIIASMLPYAITFHSVQLYPPLGLLDSVVCSRTFGKQ